MPGEANAQTLEESGLSMTDVEDPIDTDVLCGRGGAALRHPGNQTYRRLVHLNKGLYITCLKAEKLKISRSIVAAIREQNGRFLERDTKKGTWYDIGDKKAMEKTSQALREGQPKLRQRIVELGGGAAGAAALLESQFPGGSMYSMTQQQQQQAQQQQQQEQQQAMMNQQLQHGMFDSAQEMPPPQLLPPRSRDFSNEMQMYTGETPTIQEEPGNARNSFNRGTGMPAEKMGLDPQPQLSVHSMSSDFSNNFGMEPPGSQFSLPRTLGEMQAPNSFVSEMSAGSSASRKHPDRRKHFARMKYSRPPSGRFSQSGSSKQLYASNRSLGDGMPDIHLVESNRSLQSGGPPDNIANIFESRRSLMSGLSRISDASDVHSIFSDLSRKIGNVSTRSIAMSEISVMDNEEMQNELDPDSIPTAGMDEGF